MVSLFGRKIGGEKKKKADKGVLPPASNPNPRTPTKDGDAADLPTAPSGIFSSPSRPGSSQSHRFFSRKSRFFPYDSSANANSALSMANHDDPLPSPIFPPLRPATSNPGLRTHWKGGSSTSLTITNKLRKPPPPGFDLPLPRSAAPRPSTSAAPKSPLTYELTLNLPSEGVSLFPDYEELLKPPEPLRIKKQTPVASQPLTPKAPVSKPPTPPGSDRPLRSPDVLGPDRPSRGQKPTDKPHTRIDSNKTYTSRRGMETPTETSPIDRFALPTPPVSVGRKSDERPCPPPTIQIGDPMIQNVRGKRDTLIQTSPRKLSFEKFVEDFSDNILPITGDDAWASPTQNKRTARPNPLNLNVRTDLIVGSAPRSAPLGLSQRALLSMTDGPRRPQFGAPLSAGVPQHLPSRGDSRNASRTLADEYYGCFPRDDYDEPEEDRPTTPDSPLLPLTGPLASPLFRAEVQQELEDPEERMKNFRFPAIPPAINPAKSPKPAVAVTQSYRSESPTIRDSFPSANWPLPAPAAMPAQPKDLHLQAHNAQPTPQIRSFSRPLTPRKEQPGDRLTLHRSPESIKSSNYPYAASRSPTMSESGFI